MKKELNKKQATKSRLTPLTIVLLVLLILYCFTIFFSLYWAIITSFKIDNIVFGVDKYGFPNYNKYLQNSDTGVYGRYGLYVRTVIENAKEQGFLPFFTFRNVLDKYTVKTIYTQETVSMPRMYLYSVLYALGCSLTNTFTTCLAAYHCAKFRYKFSKLIHTVVIVVMIIPIVGTLPSEISLSVKLGLFNHIWGLWIMRANFLGLYFLIFYDIFKSLPTAYSEAAKIDGASNFMVFTRIALPLVRNTFFTVLLIKFITYWNDYQTPLVFMESFPTVARGLNDLIASSQNEPGSAFDVTSTPAKMSAVILTATPVVILFLVFQKHLLGNLTMGGIKG